ncbi:hypothetical protein BKI52_03555 [marine bacterium AO1-C]|nr:hypothetical protein BKI52_03555 [marine bacterium AO1-C]
MPMNQISINENLRLQSFNKNNANAYVGLMQTYRALLAESFEPNLKQLDSLGDKVAIDEILEHQKKGYYQWWLLQYQPNDQFIGAVYIHFFEDNRKCSLGYFVIPEYSRKGYITQSVQQMLVYCFNHKGMHKVIIKAEPSNLASQRIAEKCGFVNLGILRQELLTLTGETKDLAYYELLKKVWEKGLAV